MNSNLELTAAERAVLHRWRAQSEAPYSGYLGYYAAIFLPMLCFAIYGVVKRDVIAVAIAFAGLFSYQLWHLFYDFSRSMLHRSLVTKLAERERSPESH